jgi:hypothetical protein
VARSRLSAFGNADLRPARRLFAYEYGRADMARGGFIFP